MKPFQTSMRLNSESSGDKSAGSPSPSANKKPPAETVGKVADQNKISNPTHEKLHGSAPMKTKPKSTAPSPARTFLQAAWDNIPNGSWNLLNGGMHSSLNIAITTGMRFDEDDLVFAMKEFRSGYWTGNGEAVYSAACGGRPPNISAAIATEKWLGRPAYLWEEDSPTPARLYVGARFTWQGFFVTVTSMTKDYLVACTYKETEKEGYRRTNIDRRIKVTFKELSDYRRAAAAKFRKLKKEIDDITAIDPLESWARANYNRTDLRHWEIDDIRIIFVEKRRALLGTLSKAESDASDQEKIAQWQAGKDIPAFFSTVKLRVKGDRLETSRGHDISIPSAKVALAFIKKHRQKGWHSNSETRMVDTFPLREITLTKVTVGCTEIPMSEIDRITPELSNDL